MALTLKNYSKQLTEELIKSAGKNTVRECDETEKGVFVAYVDEGSNTFDVSLSVSPKGEIINSSCDCGDRQALCRHRVALLMHIATGAKTDIKPVKANKKESPAAILLDDIDVGDLKEWLKALMQKNKEIELAFTSHFSAGRQYYSPDDVIKLIKDTATAAGCNKRNADSSQVKRLVELWADVLKPVTQYYQANAMDEKAFLSFHTLVEQCRATNSGINTNSVRITRYVEDVLKESEAAINQLQAEDGWLQAAGYFVLYVPDGKYHIRMHYLLHLKSIIDGADGERKEKLISTLARQFEKQTPTDNAEFTGYAKMIFQMVSANNLFPQFDKSFKPLRYENEYNLQLINQLVANNQLAPAKKFCREQIAANYQIIYNVPYLEILKAIYATENDEKNRVQVMTQLLPYTFDFDEYLFVTGPMDEEEKKKFRVKVLTNARHTESNNTAAAWFSFLLMDYEKKYKKMIDYITRFTPYPAIYKYFERMHTADKEGLLKAIIRKSDRDSYTQSEKEREENLCFPDLFALLLKYYSPDYLKTAANSSEKKLGYYYNRENRFMTYIKEQLGK